VVESGSTTSDHKERIFGSVLGKEWLRLYESRDTIEGKEKGMAVSTIETGLVIVTLVQ
jgi:hypothetical protein